MASQAIPRDWTYKLNIKLEWISFFNIQFYLYFCGARIWSQGSTFFEISQTFKWEVWRHPFLDYKTSNFQSIYTLNTDSSDVYQLHYYWINAERGRDRDILNLNFCKANWKLMNWINVSKFWLVNLLMEFGETWENSTSSPHKISRLLHIISHSILKFY